MELFREDGCLTDAGLQAMQDGQLDELGRLEAAEHLAYCDHCMDRYTALLTAEALEPPPKGLRGAVMGTIWARLMQNTWGRAAVAGVAAVLALTLWRSGALLQITQLGGGLKTGPAEPSAGQSQLYQPVEDERPTSPEVTGKPAETGRDRRYLAEKTPSLLRKLLSGIAGTDAASTQTTEK